jgi:hypothetical protein
MGFLKEILKGFTMSTDDMIAESNKGIAEYYKKQEGLNYIEIIFSHKVWGVEREYGEISSVLLFEDRLRFDTKIKGNYRDLLLKNITNIEVLTDTQIEQKSKLGQMMLIGVFAFATKPKTEKIIDRKLVINAKESDIDFSIIIDTVQDSLNVAKKLNKFIEEYKNKTN